MGADGVFAGVGLDVGGDVHALSLNGVWGRGIWGVSGVAQWELTAQVAGAERGEQADFAEWRERREGAAERERREGRRDER